MANWKFTLPNSAKIRNLIESKDSTPWRGWESINKSLLEEIIEAYKSIWNHFGEEEDESILESIQEDIELEAFDDDCINNCLAELYDYCDERKVWIAL